MYEDRPTGNDGRRAVSDEWKEAAHKHLRERADGGRPPGDCDRDPRKPPRPRAHLRLMAISGIDLDENISMGVTVVNEGNFAALHCEASVYVAPQSGPLPPLSTLDRRSHWIFSLGPGASKSLSLPPARPGSSRLICFCHDPILDPFKFPQGQATPSDRHLAIFGGVNLE